MDPAETHWQGHRIAAAASQHEAAAGQGDSGRLESGQSTRGEGTHARRAVDPAETHWQGPSAAAASLQRATAGQGDSSQDRAERLSQAVDPAETPLAVGQPPQLEHEAAAGQGAREHARRAVDPAETHWQGHRTAAAASQHEAAAGQATQVAWSSRDRALEAGNTRSQSSGSRGDTLQGQPLQLACTGRLRGSATQVAWRQSTRGEGTRSQSSGSRGDIGKGPGQPPQLACTGRLRGSATQVAWSRDRALEAREHTLAELWIPRRRIGKGPGQPPQLACTRRLQGRATQVETEH